MSASKAQRAATADRRRQAIALKLAGMTYEQIGERLGYSSRQAARKDIDRALEMALAEQHQEAETLVLVELLRLDRLNQGHWARALAGDVKSADIVLRVHDKRVRLLRLYDLKDDGAEGISVIGRLMAALRMVDEGMPEADLDADQDDADHTDPNAVDPLAPPET